MALVKMPRRRYCREVLVAHYDGSVGIALYRYARSVFQYIAGKHSPTHFVDHGVVAKGLALFDQW
jgi:hypothetical protein